MGEATQSRLDGLQAARALAALSVAYFHSYVALRAFPETAAHPFGPLASYGYLGVNFFFAISGYVICLVVSRDKQFSLASFAIKRAFRLYPMYFVALAAVIIYIHLGKYRNETWSHLFYSATLLPQPTASAYDVSWSLEREIVFYLLAGLTIPSVGVRGLAVLLAVLAYLGYQFGNPWTFHIVSTIHADFLAGVLVFMAGPRLRTFGALVPALVGFWLLYCNIAYGVPFASSVGIGLLLISLLNAAVPWQRAPFRWLVMAGDASYSIYLTHYLVFFTSAMLCVRLPHPDWMAEPWRFAMLLVCCLISYATWRMIEVPAIALGRRLADAATGGGRVARQIEIRPPEADKFSQRSQVERPPRLQPDAPRD